MHAMELELSLGDDMNRQRTPSSPSNDAGSPAMSPRRSRFMSGESRGTHSPSASISHRSASCRSLDVRSESKASKRKSVSLSGKFIKAKSNVQELESEISGTLRSRTKGVLARILKSTYLSNFMVALVIFDAYCTCADIDSRAAKRETPYVFQLFSDVCLIMYTLELCLNVAVKGRGVLMDWTMILDVVIIVCGYVDFLLSRFGDSDFIVRMGIFRAFRLARIVRLMRLLRKTRALRELQKLVTMMATCLKALVWSSVFCFFMTSVWAMFIVEVVHPLIETLQADEGIFDECPQCQRAAGSVMQACLLLFKTVIAGDSWGLIAVPVIEAYPATALIFVGSQVTLVFGVLNLIVAVVVDTFAEARQRDILNLAEELEYDFEKDRKFLQKVFDRMDADGSGLVTFEELVEGARRDPEFQSRLRVMDIDEADLKQLFEMIDIHEQGYINATEFIAPLSRWVHDSKTAPRFIKYNLQRTMHNVEELFIFCQDCFNSLADGLEELSERLESGGTNLEAELKNNLAAATEGSSHSNAPPMDLELHSTCSRSSAGSMASDASKLDMRTLDPDFVSEAVEQPHLSKKVKVSEQVDDLGAAMEKLERYVLLATESALKKSMGMVSSSIRQRLGGDIEGLLPLRHPEPGRSRRRELPRRRRDDRHGKRSGSSNVDSAASSWALGKTFSITNSTAFRKPSKEDRPRLPAGTFAPPKLKSPNATRTSLASEDYKDPLSQSPSTTAKAFRKVAVGGSDGERE